MDGSAQDRSAADLGSATLWFSHGLSLPIIEVRSSSGAELISSLLRRRAESFDLRGGAALACRRRTYGQVCRFYRLCQCWRDEARVSSYPSSRSVGACFRCAAGEPSRLQTPRLLPCIRRELEGCGQSLLANGGFDPGSADGLRTLWPPCRACASPEPAPFQRS